MPKQSRLRALKRDALALLSTRQGLALDLTRPYRLRRAEGSKPGPLHLDEGARLDPDASLLFLEPGVLPGPNELDLLLWARLKHGRASGSQGAEELRVCVFGWSVRERPPK